MPRRTAAPFPLPRLLSAALLLALLGVQGCSPAMRGSMALATGDYPAALDSYHEALRQNPDSLYLRQRIGLTYFAMGDYARAEASFHNLLQLTPNQPEAFFYLGLSRIGKGEREAGLEMLGRQPWPFKFYHQKFVREEAERLQHHPELPPGEAIRSLLDALELGRREQLLLERDMLDMRGRLN